MSAYIGFLEALAKINGLSSDDLQKATQYDATLADRNDVGILIRMVRFDPREEAWPKLIDALVAKKIEAFEKQGLAIPATFWAGLTFQTASSHPLWTRCLLPAARITNLWPSIASLTRLPITERAAKVAIKAKIGAGVPKNRAISELTAEHGGKRDWWRNIHATVQPTVKRGRPSRSNT